jgi:hypothetical protein
MHERRREQSFEEDIDFDDAAPYLTDAPECDGPEAIQPRRSTILIAR